MSATGIIAALGAPFVMTLGFVIWDKHWTGSAFALNLYKCTLASVGFLVVSISTRVAATSGPAFPPEIFTARSVGFLMLSSAIGILIGDWTWLEALRLIGARRVIVVDTIKPFLAALFGWAILGEELPPSAFGGMALTVLGVLWVSLEKETPDTEEDEVENDVMSASAATSENISRATSMPLDVDDDATIDATVRRSNLISEEQPSDRTVSDTHNTEERPSNEEKAQSPEPKTSKTSRRRSIRPKDMRYGYGLSLLNVVLDTYGSLLTKEHGVGMSTWEINLIRFGFASACCLSLSLVLHLHAWFVVRRKGKSEERTDGAAAAADVEEGTNTNASLKSSKSNGAWGENTTNDAETVERSWYCLPVLKRRSWMKVSVGVLFVTFLCPALSNYALFQIALALALTLGSVGPLYALPLTWLLQRERPTLRSCLGALVAVAGIAVLSFFGTTY